MRIALYQPDIPQNCGTLLRLAACLGLPADIIEPCGFLFDDKRLRRSGMDYLDQVEVIRHRSWTAYEAQRRGRLILLTTQAATAYTRFDFEAEDNLLLGRESAGVPSEVHEAAQARIVIPMRPEIRSLNVATAAAMVVGEALRQTSGFPAPRQTRDDKTEKS